MPVLSYKDKLLLQSTKHRSPGALETNSNQELYGSVKGAALGSTSLESRGVCKAQVRRPNQKMKKGIPKKCRKVITVATWHSGQNTGASNLKAASFCLLVFGQLGKALNLQLLSTSGKKASA